ncbi:MAG: branched-chain amino acid ABC transporter permease, partial [Kiloniellales bacterium]|nr:branched-chain amino acid ABC transporter permease [Kiloniellales bacterium]
MNLRLSARALYIIAGGALLLSLPLAADLTEDPFLLDLGSRILIYAIAAVGLDLIVGFGGLISLGHAAFFGLGGYTVAILSFHLNDGSSLLHVPVFPGGSEEIMITLPAAAAVSALAACGIGALSLRTSGVYFIMITLAFAQMIYFLFITVPTYGGEDGLVMWSRNHLGPIDLSKETSFYYVCLGLLCLVLLLAYRLTRSRFGLIFQASKSNEQRLSALGYPVYRYRLLAFTLSGGI